MEICKNYIKNNFKVLKNVFLKYCAVIFPLLEVITIFISLEDLGFKNKHTKILFFSIILIFGVIIAVICICLRKKKQIFGDTSNGCYISYGNIIESAFNNKNSKEKIIVIHVNRCFDLSCENNLIRKDSIHGQFLQKFIHNDEERNKLHNYIENDLKNRNIDFDTLKRHDKKHGYLKRYPAGTVVKVASENNVIFYLLALSQLDNNLKAKCTELEFYKALSELLNYYDSHGKGVDLYCSVMGDKIVSPHKKTKEIIDFMVSVFKFNKNTIRGNINLVVYEKLKSEISILDY